MSWTRIFAICICFEVFIAAPLSYWLMWQFAYKSDAVSAVGMNVLIPAILIAPLLMSAFAYRRGTKA